MGACGNNTDDKIPEPSGEFDYTRVLVVLTKPAASLEKEWTPADFPGFAFSKIDNGFYVDDVYYKYDGGYLVFHLAKPSRKNVLMSIYYLSHRPEIKSVEVNGLVVPMPNTGDI